MKTYGQGLFGTGPPAFRFESMAKLFSEAGCDVAPG